MWKHSGICICIAGIFCLAEIASAQFVTIQSITISGVKRTKESIVYRELTFAVGDTLLQLDIGTTLERNRNNLLNLGIFNEAIVNVSEWDTDQNLIDITIELKESWYIYAVPIIELADRNFNVWWTTHNHAFNRLNLGARLEWLNFSGRNDKLKAKLQVGYTPKQEAEYRFPYLGKRQTLGITTGFLHSVNKEMNYTTVNNREQFVRLDERLLQERWKGRVTTTYRPSIFLKYELSFNLEYYDIDAEVIRDYNPLYFRNGGNIHKALAIQFAFEYDDRDIRIFPERGTRVLFETEKTGLGKRDDENNLISTLNLEWNATSGRRFQHRVSSVMEYSLSRSRPSYLYYEGLGTDQKYVSGYELYIVNGLDLFVAKYQIAYKILEKKIKFGRMMPVEQFRQMSFAIYLSVNGDVGYVNDPFTGAENFLANRWLYGGGPGVNFLLYNNFLFQFNVSGNHLGEWGVFVHNKTSF